MLKIFSVFDVKAAAYNLPAYLPTRGLALRAFSDACAQQNSPMAQYPGDYAMYELGEFDPNSGKFTSYPEPILVATASAVMNQLRAVKAVEPSVKEVAS